MLVKPLVRSIVRAIAGVPTKSLGSGFSPTSLFADGSKGVVYDNNDLSTFFLDAAGTTAATVNGLVGLQLDKSANLALGAELSAYASGFSSTAGITGVGSTVAISSTSLLVTATSTDGSDRAEIPVSGLTVGKFYVVTFVARRGAQGIQQYIRSSTCFNDIPSSQVASTSPQTITFRTQATATSGVVRAYSADGAGAIGDELYVDSLSVKELPGNHRYQTTTGSKPVLRGTPIGANIVANGDFASGTGWTTGAGWAIGSGVATATTSSGTLTSALTATIAKVYRLTYTITASAGSIQPSFGGVTGASRTAAGTYVEYLTASSTAALVFTGTTFSGTVDNVEIVDVSAGQVTAPYGLQYDGVDDFMQTASVDFTATDKMFVCAGVRKLSDAAAGVVVEFSTDFNSNSGVFYLLAPPGGSTRFGGGSKGTIAANTQTSTGFDSPYLGVLTQIGNISGDSSVLRLNAVERNNVVTDQGAGNFGNYAMYFGRRGGASLPYNGLDFGMVICGKTLTSTQISQTERYIAQRTGVVI